MPNTNSSNPNTNNTNPSTQKLQTVTTPATQPVAKPEVTNLKPVVPANKATGTTIKPQAAVVSVKPEVQTTSQTTQPNVPVHNTLKAKPQTPIEPAAKMLPVKVAISGKTYTINCPADETSELKSATVYIDNFIQSIRKQAPHLTHENLLVLCCLNLYEQMQNSAKLVAAKEVTDEKAQQLVEKMIKDMTMV